MIFKSYIQLVCPDARQTDGRTAGGYNSPTSLVVWAWKIARTLHWLVGPDYNISENPTTWLVCHRIRTCFMGDRIFFGLSTLVNVPFFFSKSLKLINAKQHFDGGQCGLQKRTSTISLIICSLSLSICYGQKKKSLCWTKSKNLVKNLFGPIFISQS